MVRLTVTRSANTFSEPRTSFYRCSTVRSIQPCTAWKKEDGWSPNGRLRPTAIGSLNTTGLTDKGKKQLVVEESQWKQMAEAVARVMWPAAEES